jgi:DNA-binding response OmpR family regulator
MKSQILIIDDEAPIREMLSLYLRKKGFDVATAMTGRSAVELLESQRFDLAILDVDLNGENGLDLLKHFKSDYSQMAIVMLSGKLDEDLPAKAMAGGADGFMRKTDSLHELFAEVCRHITA